MKSMLVYGIATTFMAYAVMAGEKKVSRTLDDFENAETPRIMASTNATTKAFASATANATAKASSTASSDGTKKNVKTKEVNKQHTTRK